MAIALIALLLMETVLLMAWVASYFSWGIPLFNERIAASPAMQARLSLGSLERDLPRDKWLRLAFHALPDGSLCSWFVAILSLLLLPLVAMRPMVAPMLLVLPLLLASYLVQKRRYAAIVEALRMQLKAEFPR